MGRIGRTVARRAAAFGLSIAYHNRHRLPFEVEQELQAHWHGDLDSLLAGSDIVSIHCPLNADSRGMIDARRIALMMSCRLGPTLFLPASTVWQALHLLNTFSPAAEIGSAHL